MISSANPSPTWTERGRLRVACFNTHVGQPAPGARITVSAAGNPDRVIEQMTTDAVGQSITIDLSAPPAALSLSEADERYKPYSTYDLSVELPGFDPVRIEGVQILAGETALQDVRMTPVRGSTGQTQSISIYPHTLWGTFPPKTPEEEVKHLPEAEGFVVLPKPVVPEYIVVHTGAPGSSAQNHRILFKDYIKNVASCEIYSTWPDSTIRANVLAILSFTLNRVYTEWYRAKGYDFQITNSTSYDQAFTYGRNIFDNISRIVDDIFTTYITRPGIRQPLFAQYCDGRRVTCPNWMTQWGSKELGEQGAAAIDILKHFYGQDIYLVQAERVAGVPESYPGTPLQVGSTGEAVRTVQEQLNAVAGNYPLIPKVRVDGIFGESTREAAETFQRIFNLSDDGIVGLSTWYKLSNIYTSVTNMASGTPR